MILISVRGGRREGRHSRRKGAFWTYLEEILEKPNGREKDQRRVR